MATPLLAMFVTVPILIYQFAIGSLIVAAGVLFGRRGAKWAGVLALLWTLTHVVLLPLMCLQLVTVSCATALSFALAKRRPPAIGAVPPTPADALGARRVDAEVRDAPEPTEPTEPTAESDDRRAG